MEVWQRGYTTLILFAVICLREFSKFSFALTNNSSSLYNYALIDFICIQINVTRTDSARSMLKTNFSKLVSDNISSYILTNLIPDSDYVVQVSNKDRVRVNFAI